MHFSYTKQKIFLLASISLYIMIALFLNSLDSGTYKFDSKSSNINESIEDDNAATVYLQLKEFDSVSQTLKELKNLILKSYPLISGRLASVLHSSMAPLHRVIQALQSFFSQ